MSRLDKKQALSRLGLGGLSSFEEAKKSYRKKAMELHPDRQLQNGKTQGQAKAAEEEFKEVKSAWEWLEELDKAGFWASPESFSGRKTSAPARESSASASNARGTWKMKFKFLSQGKINEVARAFIDSAIDGWSGAEPKGLDSKTMGALLASGWRELLDPARYGGWNRIQLSMLGHEILRRSWACGDAGFLKAMEECQRIMEQNYRAAGGNPKVFSETAGVWYTLHKPAMTPKSETFVLLREALMAKSASPEKKKEFEEWLRSELARRPATEEIEKKNWSDQNSAFGSETYAELLVRMRPESFDVLGRTVNFAHSWHKERDIDWEKELPKSAVPASGFFAQTVWELCEKDWGRFAKALGRMDREKAKACMGFMEEQWMKDQGWEKDLPEWALSQSQKAMSASLDLAAEITKSHQPQGAFGEFLRSRSERKLSTAARSSAKAFRALARQELPEFKAALEEAKSQNVESGALSAKGMPLATFCALLALREKPGAPFASQAREALRETFGRSVFACKDAFGNEALLWDNKVDWASAKQAFKIS